MWTGSIKDKLLLDKIYDQCKRLENGQATSIGGELLSELAIEFPDCNEKALARIFFLIQESYKTEVNEKTEIVLTAPKSFKLKAKNTSTVLYEMIRGAKKSITITGYSISSHVSDLLDEIVRKSKQGVYINLYLNDFEQKAEQLEKVILHNNRFIRIYDYNQAKDDKMAALHAKIIVVDSSELLISSSNLSYHGLEGNIEMGMKLCSKQKAKELEQILKQLVYEKVFTRVQM